MTEVGPRNSKSLINHQRMWHDTVAAVVLTHSNIQQHNIIYYIIIIIMYTTRLVPADGFQLTGSTWNILFYTYLYTYILYTTRLRTLLLHVIILYTCNRGCRTTVFFTGTRDIDTIVKKYTNVTNNLHGQNSGS